MTKSSKQEIPEIRARVATFYAPRIFGVGNANELSFVNREKSKRYEVLVKGVEDVTTCFQTDSKELAEEIARRINSPKDCFDCLSNKSDWIKDYKKAVMAEVEGMIEEHDIFPDSMGSHCKELRWDSVTLEELKKRLE